MHVIKNILIDKQKEKILWLLIVSLSLMISLSIIFNSIFVIAALGAFVFIMPIMSLYALFFIAALLGDMLPVLVTLNGFDLRASDIFIIILLIRVMIHYAKNREKMIKADKTTNIWVLIFLCFVIFSLLKALLGVYNDMFFTQLSAFLRWFAYMLILFLSPTILNSQNKIKKAVYLLLGGVIAQSIFSLVLYNQSKNAYFRANGFGSVSDYAIICVFAIALIYSLILNKVGNAIFNYSILAFLIFSLFITFTRNAYIIFIFITLVFIVKYAKNKLIWLSVILMVVSALAFVFWDVLKVRLSDVGYFSENNGSIYERYLLIKLALVGVWNEIFLGYGWSGFRLWSTTLLQNQTNDSLNYLFNRTQNTESHSQYASMLFDGGILGLLAFIMMLKKFQKTGKEILITTKDKFLKSISPSLYYWLLGMLIWFMFDQILPGTQSTLYFWMVLGIIYSIKKQNERIERVMEQDKG